ncbi:cysteine synthase A [Candidatus Sumerlaeota bacterium]|nr:cysteine synthase A [Candidatus Sumerlaeota bacterium]
MAKIYQNITELIGGTPLVKLNKLPDQGAAEVCVKLEGLNPGGSIKDRIGLSMIEAAEKEGLLKPGSTIVEPTSGNTGIALAMVAATRGYRVILTMPDSMSVERRLLFKRYGAELVLTPAANGMKGAIEKAVEIMNANPGSFMPQQFKNLANPEAHRRATALEIWNDTDGQVDAFVSGVGTGGTITGVASVLKEKNPQIKVYAVEPVSSAVLSGEGPGKHRIQGIGAGFVPEVLNTTAYDAVIKVDDQDAYNMMMRLSTEEGISVGISSGATVCAGLQVARELGAGKRVVVIAASLGERYLSLFEIFQPEIVAEVAPERMAQK